MKNKTFFLSGVLALVLIGGIAGIKAVNLQAAGNDNKIPVIVSFAQTPGSAEEGLIRAFGGTVNYAYSIVPAIATALPESAIKNLARNPRVTAIEQDEAVYALDVELDNSWGVKRIGAGTAHLNGRAGAGVKIGIIDSGINYAHPDLDGVYAGGYDFVQSDADPMDVDGHGTHVAGTACAEDNDLGVVGVAPACALYALRVLDDNGVGSWSKIIAALDWAVNNNLQVVNLSLGSSKNPGTAVKTAFGNAEAAGIVIVAAAGNSGNTAGKGDNVIYPAKYPSVIAVGATDTADKRASFSSTGSALEIMAPGVSVFSTWNDASSAYNPQPVCVDGLCYYKYSSGTSMAAPHVAGVAALILANGIADTNGNGRTNDEVRQKMNSTAQDLGAAGRDTQYGYGLVNAFAVTQ